jgi:hypothetical protein
MDRQTKAALWIAFTILLSYFVWFFLDCAMDDACHIVCVNGGRGGCHAQRTHDLKQSWSPQGKTESVRPDARGPYKMTAIGHFSDITDPLAHAFFG